MPSSISSKPLMIRGVNFQASGFFIKNSDLSMMLETPWFVSLSLVNTKLGELGVQVLYKEKEIRPE